MALLASAVQINRQFSFLEAVVAFPAVAAGNYGEVLLRVADRLCEEAPFDPAGEIPGARSTLGEVGVMAGVLNSEDRALVADLRRGLAKIAAGLSDTEDADLQALDAALDGVEMTMLGELVSGKEAQLPSLMPSFVFLVALSIAGQDRALELSERTKELVKEELRRQDRIA